MYYPFCLFIGLLPSVIWLLIFLSRDVHPESKGMILKIFFYGALATIPAYLMENGFKFFFVKDSYLGNGIFLFFYMVLGVAAIEESLKYLVVREKVLLHPEFDEPTDVMVYMITSAMGFAALENILIFLSPNAFGYSISQTLSLAGYRFISATFLHALCSGIIGFFLALSLYETKKRDKLFALGIMISILLHGLYNFYIIKLLESKNQQLSIFSTVSLISIFVGLVVLIGFCFRKLKKLKSVCKI
ncbi:MAG: PrsW family intramembrane metalloprotease [Candidatus Pacebacteria bacterium]|nr:PrsW family intramembrane metalloprotease [Candidatus Paceibacterota bacterium]